MNLVFGERRLEACFSLEWETIPARIVEVPALLAEHDENEIRKDFTPSERVAIGKAIEATQFERRGRPSDKTHDSKIVQNFAQFEPGQKTRDFIAKAIGFDNAETFRRPAGPPQPVAGCVQVVAG
ncbi:MAG: hypothetical protein H7834_16350 [Magnetococcus sp. YQC-9]